MIQFGNDKIKEIYVGSDKIKEVYHGSDLVWRWKLSYAILTDDTRIDFELENTPIANLCTSLSTMAINGVSYGKSRIKEIHFGSSYSGVTEIGERFLQDCSSLTDVILNFPVLSTVDDFFLFGCLELGFLTLDFPALTSVGVSFLRNCTSLTDVTLTTETPPNASSSYFMNSTKRLSSISVPANSVNLYKTTSPWSNHASKIQGYGEPSYAILTDATRVDFELKNTPISNLEGTATSIILNGTSYQKTTIKEITFGDSYGNVTSIGEDFLLNCSALTSLDLSVFSNVTSIGGIFLGGCSSLISLDLSVFSNVTSIDDYFLYYCSNLTQFKIGAINVPQAETTGFLQNTTALTTILVPMQSVQAYKTTTPWSNHASIITGY